MSDKTPSVCPVCKGRSFLTEQKGRVFKRTYYVCQHCDSVLKQQKSGYYQIEKVGEDYTNLIHVLQGDILPDNQLLDFPSMSDEELDKVSRAESPIFDETIEVFKRVYLEDYDLPVFLKKGETAIYIHPNVRLFEERSTRVSSGTRAGVRVMKGVYISQSITGPEYEGVVKHIDSGSFVITDKRYIFTGEKRNIDQSLGKITTVEIFPDGISIARSNKQKTEYFYAPSHWNLIGSVLKGVVTKFHQQ